MYPLIVLSGSDTKKLRNSHLHPSPLFSSAQAFIRKRPNIGDRQSEVMLYHCLNKKRNTVATGRICAKKKTSMIA